MPAKLGTDRNHYNSEDLPVNHVPLDIIDGQRCNHVDDEFLPVTDLCDSIITPSLSVTDQVYV